MNVRHQSVEAYGRTTLEALTKAVSELHEKYGSDSGCQFTAWYGVDGKTGMPVCRLTFLVITPDKKR